MEKDHKEHNMICFPRLGSFGNLGNAMFQYAAVLGIADKTGYEPVYDFNATGTTVTLHKHFNLTKAKHKSWTDQVHGIGRIWKEPYFHFCEDAFKIPDNTGIQGYFQSEKYFSHIADRIKSEFKFNEDMINNCKEKMNDLKSLGKTVIGIHVRLGDYTQLPNVFVQLLQTDYYNRAFQLIEQEVQGDKMYVVFSDNISMCKNVFRGANFAFAENGTPIQDMCMMSLCDHVITANSSFSWWGAWLNDSADKKVIAPRGWFVDNPQNQKDTKDLYCPGWTVL